MAGFKFNANIIKQEMNFEKYFKISFRKKRLEDLIVSSLDNEEVFNMTISLDPKVHSINAFLTFFFIHDHHSDKKSNTGFSKLLWTDENSRILYAGSQKDGQLIHCGFQSKEFYPLSEFITQHDLWPNIEDIQLKRAATIKGRCFSPFKKLLRMMVRILSAGRFFKPAGNVSNGKQPRGYSSILEALKTHGRHDLIDLCEKHSRSVVGDSLFPMVLRSVAENNPQRLMEVGADNAIILAMETFYSGRYKRNVLQRYIPKLKEFGLTLAGLLVRK